MTGADALRAVIPRLREAGIPDAARDARALLAHAMEIAADRLTLHLADDLTPEVVTALGSLIVARARHQPVAQIIGHRQFWGRSFVVSPDVLDPRPETETLVAAALSGRFDRVLDLGTGSGCILLTLLLDRPSATGLGIDLSPAALAVADRNRQRFGLQSRAVLQQGNWVEGLSGSFDLIVSNPPYIATAEMAGLAPDVRDWEPHMALTPGGDGLAAYRVIMGGAGAHLVPGGRLLMEIGPTQGHAVAAMLEAAGLQNVAILPDLDGRDRVVSGRTAA